MNKAVVLAAFVLCTALAAPASGQVPCSSLYTVLVVEVEAAGHTAEDALRNLDGEVATVQEVAGTPCVSVGEPSVELYTDGSWHASLEVSVPGHEYGLRDLAASLDEPATPVEIVGLFPRSLGVGFVTLLAVVGVLVGYVRITTKGEEIGAGMATVFVLMAGVLAFFITNDALSTWF